MVNLLLQWKKIIQQQQVNQLPPPRLQFRASCRCEERTAELEPTFCFWKVGLSIECLHLKSSFLFFASLKGEEISLLHQSDLTDENTHTGLVFCNTHCCYALKENTHARKRKEVCLGIDAAFPSSEKTNTEFLFAVATLVQGKFSP